MEARHSALLMGYGVNFEALTTSRELGRGGFGAVCAGRYFCQEVAVKQMHGQKTVAVKQLHATEKEFLLHFHLRHVNVAAVLCFNVDLSRGPVTLVMERFEVSLDDLLHGLPFGALALGLSGTRKGPRQEERWGDTSGPLPLRVRLGFLLGAARGLAFLHGRGVMHLDVKPANLMLDAGGVVKLADFGLARLTAEVAETDCDDGAALGEGSLPWMAPELINQAPPPTPAADVFSLYAVLFELCSGEPPHAIRGPQAIVRFMSRHKRLALPDDAALLALPGDDARAAVAEKRAPAAPSPPGSSPRVASGEALPPLLRHLYGALSHEQPDERPTAAEVARQLKSVLGSLPPLGAEKPVGGRAARANGAEAAGARVAAAEARAITAEAAAAAAAAALLAAERVYRTAASTTDDAAEAARLKAAGDATRRAQGHRAGPLAVAAAAGAVAALGLLSVYLRAQRRSRRGL